MPKTTDARYWKAEEVLPPELLEKCYEKLGGYRAQVTFRNTPYGYLLPSEKRLGQRLSYACRVQMHGRQPMRVYFSGRRNELKLDRFEVAKRLIRLGNSTQAVADVIGVTRRTLRNRGVESQHNRWSLKPVEFSEEGLVRGLIQIAKVKSFPGGPSPKRDPEKALKYAAGKLKQEVETVHNRACACAMALDDLENLDVLEDESAEEGS